MMCRRYIAEIVMTSFLWVTVTTAAFAGAAAATVPTTTTATTVIKEPGVVSSVWVVRGERADLPCAPSPKLSQDSAVLVLWYRSSNTLPVYSYDAREGEFTSGVPWADDGVLGGRAYYLPASEPPMLVLDPAHARDQGVYTCRVDYRLSPSTTAYVNLTVVIPPGPPMILWGGRGVVSVVGPLGEGERVELTCRSVGGRPPPTLTWMRRGQRMPVLSYNSTADAEKDTYWVQAVVAIVGSRELLGSTLSCHTHAPTHAHLDLIQQQTASVIVNVTLAPVEVRILGSGSAVTAGTTLRLVCRAAGSHPPAHLTWWRAHTRLPQVTHSIEAGGNVTTAMLTMNLERSHNGATLSCTASNPALPRVQHLTDTIKLNVYYPPVVRLSMGRPLDPENIKEGDDVYFECSIVSNPPFQRVDWHHNGVLVAHNITSGVVVSGLSLVLRRLRREHSGSYRCGANNTEGYNTSNPVSLSVRHSPMCAGDKRERTQGAARGSTAAVKCTVEAEPAQGLTWTWIRKRADGSEEEVPQSDVRSDGLTSSVLLTPRTPDDYGRFLCLAANVVGQQRAACVVNLVPAGPPDTPTNCSVTPADLPAHDHTHTASLAITCIEGFDGGLPQHFTLETWQDGSLAANMSRMFPEWFVTGLRAGVGVTLRVAAHNARGRSDVIRFEVHTASAQQHAAPDSEWGLLGVPPLLGALVGVGGVLLIILVTGVIIAKYTWRTQAPTHVHTLVMTPTARPTTDTYDPDVVSSLRRHADNLDVLPATDYSQKSTAAKAHAQKQAVIRTHVQGQSVTQAYVNRHGNKHQSITRGFCLHRQDSPFPDSDSDDSDDSDSDSTFTDLTAAGRAAAALPPPGRCSNSLPRPAKRELRHVASSSLDLQLHSCQRSQIVASSNGVIQRVPCFTRNPRRPLPASSEELRHLTSSAEELHPLIFSGDLRHLLSSGDLRHLSFSGTELRMVPSTGTWPPLSSSSGEMRLPLPSSATMQSLTTEELRILPSSSSSSPWDVQGMPSFSQLPPSHQQLPSLPPCAEILPQLPYLDMQPQTPRGEVQQRPPCGGQQIRQPQATCGELYTRPSGAEAQSVSPCLDPQARPCCTRPQPGQQLQQRSSFSDLCQRPPCSEHYPPPPGTGTQPRPPCLKQKSLPSPLSCLELEPTVSLRELQPPQPSGELQPLLPLVELQPPPSFRGPQTAELSFTETSNLGSLPPKTQVVERPSCSQVTHHRRASHEQLPSNIATNDVHLVKYPTGVGTQASSPVTINQFSPSSATQKLVRFSGENPNLSDVRDRSPPSHKDDKFSPAGKLPLSIPRPPTDMPVRPSFQDNQAQPTPLTSNTGNKTQTARREPKGCGKQVSFSDDESLQAPVVVRVPAKSGKSEKRCAQLFSNIDVSPSSISKQQSLETASGADLPWCSRTTATTAAPPNRTTQSPSPSKTTMASKLSPGTPEKAVHRDAITPPKPPRGSPQSSSVALEEPHTLLKPGDQLDSHEQAFPSDGSQESFRSEVVPEINQISPNPSTPFE